MEDAYAPPATRDRNGLQEEINMLQSMLLSIDPHDPETSVLQAYCQGLLAEHQAKLAHSQPEPTVLTIPRPAPAPAPALGWSSSACNTAHGSSHHKRHLSHSDDMHTRVPEALAWPSESSRKRSRPSPADHFHNQMMTMGTMFSLPDACSQDLAYVQPEPNTVELGTPVRVPSGHRSFVVDPFPELGNAYQPDHVDQAVQQVYMSESELASFLLSSPPIAKAPLPLPLPKAVARGNVDGTMSNPEVAQYLLGSHPKGIGFPQRPNAVAGVNNNGSQIKIGGGRESDKEPVDYYDYIFENAPSPYANLEDEIFGDMASLKEDPEAVQNLIENIQDHEGLPPEEREPTPKAMCSTLMEHQKIGLTWLLKMENSNSKGGILADEMGLGKTVQALALLLANPSTDPACKTTLIVAPIALMRQWAKELERHVRQHHHLKVYMYHGNSKKVTFAKLRTCDVVLTTFGTLASEYKSKTNQEAKLLERARFDPDRSNSMYAASTLLGSDSKWYRVILDEAQCIKNRQTLTSKAAHDLKSTHRLCLTGTPMMNSIQDLYAQIRFLRIAPYEDWAKFNWDLIKPLYGKSSREWTRKSAMQRLQVLLKSIMLRRCKTTVVDEKPICDLPPKDNHDLSVEFSKDERELYKAIENKYQLQFNKYLDRGTVNNNYANVLVMLLRLRQVCCHPHLISDLGIQVSTEGIAEDELKERAKQLSPEVVARLKEATEFDCPICFELEVNPTIFLPCGHICCGDCFQKLIDPSRAIREGDEDSGAKCPHCRGKLSTNLITDYVHFLKVHLPEKLQEMKQGARLEFSSGDEDGSETEDESCASSDSEGDSLTGFIVDDGHESNLEDSGSDQEIRVKAKKKGKGKAKARPKVTLAQLKKESIKSKAAKRRYNRRLQKNYQSSAKVTECIQLLEEIQQNDATEKTLIFSQFTSLLDLLEVPIIAKGFKYQRFDGTMNINDRAEAVEQFMDNPDVTVMLVSIKAGNAGLNLNKASQVIIMDPFYNPMIEEQAVDRAHRMPQQRIVHVHRLLVPETVEDRIRELQDKKREIIGAALDSNAAKSLNRLSVTELRFLFGLGGPGQGAPG